MNRMCTCAVHCTRSAYHERACCDGPLCDCWCHSSINQRGPQPVRSMAVLEADTSRESCRESSGTMEKNTAGALDLRKPAGMPQPSASRLAHVTGSLNSGR